MSTLKLTKEDGRAMLGDDHDDWKEIEQEIVDTGRWDIHYTGIFKHIPTGKFYMMHWSVGATEMQDTRPFEYDDPELFEVEAKQVTVTQWVIKKDEE